MLCEPISLVPSVSFVRKSAKCSILELLPDVELHKNKRLCLTGQYYCSDFDVRVLLLEVVTYVFNRISRVIGL